MQEFSLSSDTAAQVNLANGNLLVSAQDTNIQSAGIPLTINRYYNSQETGYAGSLRGAWRFGSGADVGIDGLSDDNGELNETQTFYGPNGFKTVFTRDYVDVVDDTFTSAPGFNGTLTAQALGSRFFTYQIEYHSSGEKLSFNRSGYLTAHTDRNGVGLAYQYDAAGKLSSINGNRAVFTYDANGKVTKITDIAGRETGYAGTTSLNSVTRPDASVTSYTYDANNRLKTIVLPGFGASTKTVTFTYDTSNRIKTLSEQRFSLTWGAETAATTTFTYNVGNTVVVDPRGNSSTFTLDSQGRVTTAKDPLNRARTQQWTANSDIQSTTDAFASGSTPGNQTVAAYDEMNRQTSVSLPTGALTQALYAQGANCPTSKTGTERQTLCTIDSAGNRTSNTYDVTGNLLKESDTTGSEKAKHTYTRENEAGTVCGGRAGQVCTSKDGNNNLTTYGYDASGNVTNVTPPAPLGQTISTYDTLNRLLTTTDGNGDVTTYGYDVRDRITLTRFDDGTELRTFWNKNGTKSSEVDTKTAITISYQYDSIGNQTQKAFGTAAPMNMRYDASGNLTSYQDASGTVAYKYDAANQLVSVQEPTGTCPSNGNPPSGSKCTIFTYNANGAESSRTFPGGAKQETSYDASGRPTKILAKDGANASQVEINYSYSLNGSDTGLIRSRTSTKEQGVPAGAVTTYGYDTKNHLTSAEEKLGSVVNASWKYSFDNAGNRTTQEKLGNTGGAAGTATYSYNAANQLVSSSLDTTSWVYDGVGNLTRNGITGTISSYGDRQQVTQQGLTSYATFGQGNMEQTSAGTTTYATSALGLARSTSGANTTMFVRDLAGEPTSSKTGSSGNIYFIKDALGSTVGIFSETGTYLGGYSYSPYGEQRSTGTNAAVQANPLRYIGGFQEQTNVYKLGARYYDTTTGRFTQMDPSGQEPHPYAYSNCNPINAKDPSGLSLKCLIAAIASFAGLAFMTAETIVIAAGVLGAPATAGASIAASVVSASLYVGTVAATAAAILTYYDECGIW